jgi:hypothetical protein
MDAMLSSILWQTLYYTIACVLIVFFVAILQKGFFWKYLRVRSSFGKYVLIKVRTKIRDYFIVGWVKDNFLEFKDKDSQGVKIIKRISLPDGNVFYKCLSVLFVDMSEDKNALLQNDYSAVAGFDTVKYSNLYERALTRPVIGDNKQLIIIVLLLVIAVAVLIGIYFGYKNSQIGTDIVAYLARTVGNRTATATIISGGSL